VNVGPIGNGNLDDSTSNPHRSGTIDATMWAVGGTTIGGANFDAIKWFNLNVSCKVTWVAQDPLGNLPDDSQFLRFRLRGFSGSIPRVIATDVVVETQFDAPASAGQTTITQNSDINPAGTFAAKLHRGPRAQCPRCSPGYRPHRPIKRRRPLHVRHDGVPGVLRTGIVRSLQDLYLLKKFK